MKERAYLENMGVDGRLIHSGTYRNGMGNVGVIQLAQDSDYCSKLQASVEGGELLFCLSDW
jgi:hypothetical protein